jgi:amino acid adenylation domain-containing protein
MLQSATDHGHLFGWFERHALAVPDAVAVVDDDGAVTYCELAHRANDVARRLQAVGVAAEQPVGVLMHRRADLLAVLLGILKAGAAYVPFDPQDPPDRVRRMLGASGCTLVLGDALLLGALESRGDAGAPVAPSWRGIEVASIVAGGAGDEPVVCSLGGSGLAYLLFTSGSTGEPKAVEVEHRQVLALLRSAAELLRFGPRDRYLAASTIAFDASITELFLPLVTGGSLLLRDRSVLLDPHRLARDVRDHGVSVVATGPSVWRVVLNEVPDFPRVRIAITHGEAVGPELAQCLCAYADEAWNLYGPTETTVWATGCRLSVGGASGLSPASAPIGCPLPHVHAFVVDDQGAPVPDGNEGELCLGGPSVARGYRGQQALTRERFVEIAGERVYRSGDVVVRDASGVLHYFGRNDDQIKVRGVRVEPGEIEAAIQRDPRVAHAAATWFPTPGGARAIVAAVVLQPGAHCRPQDLHEGLVARLPSTMIPARFLFVPWLPMTTSGKVDRKVIREAVAAAAGDAPSGSEPSPAQSVPVRALRETERAVAQVWQRMLGVAQVAPDDHFFSIGGDSLTAVQMMVEVEALFGLVLPVHLAFEAPTLEALCRRIEQAQVKVEDEDAHGFIFPVVPAGQGAPLFFSDVDLTLARRGLWNVPCPLYAIANWAKGAGFVQAGSLQALAAAHVASVRRVQPAGPYRLAGFSLGGLIAYEMAQQLRADGQEVEMLFLLDPMAPHHVDLPGYSMPPQAALNPLPVRIVRRVRRLAQEGPRGWTHWLKQLLVRHLPLVDWYWYVTVNFHLRRPNAISRMLFPRDRWQAFWFVAQRLVKGYSARPYDGPVLAVFCQQGPRGVVWKALLGSTARIHDLDADHMDLFVEPARSRWMSWLAVALHRGR